MIDTKREIKMTRNLFKILIVDDEPEARNLLKSLLSDIGGVKIVDAVDTVERALYSIIEYYPDLILLDISLPGKSGIDLVKLINKRNIEVPVVFVSAYKDYAIEAMRSGVYDFLLKPVSKEDFINLIEKHRRIKKKGLPQRLMEVLNSIKEENKIKINSRHSYILIRPDEIVYCHSEEGYTNIYLNNGKTEVANTSLTLIEAKVKQHGFYKLSRSVLINLKYVRSVCKSDNTVVFKSGENLMKVNVPRRAIKELLQEIYNYA